MSDWLRQAEALTKLAKDAMITGDHVVMIAALHRAAECIQLAKLTEAGAHNAKDERSKAK